MKHTVPGMDENKSNKAYSFLIPAFAGAVSGFVTRLITGPLDTLKIRNQLLWQHSGGSKQQSIINLTRAVIQEEGVLALWKGTIPGMCLWMSYSFIQFGTYDFLQNYHVANVAPILIPTSILNGAVAASAATTITYPFDIIRTQFVVQGRVLHYNSMYSFVQHSINSYGYSGAVFYSIFIFELTELSFFLGYSLLVFYKGLSAALLGVAPYMGLNFFLYNKMKYLITQEQRTSSILTWVRSSSWFPWEGVAGGIAGGIAKFTFYPLDTMKRRMQVQVLHSSLTHAVAEQQSLGYSRLSDCIIGMWKQEGIRAFYRGMVPTILKAVGSSAVGFVSYESAKRLLEEVLQ